MLPVVAVTLALASDPNVQVQLLAAHYRAFDLPLPPPKAKLFRFTIQHTTRPGEPPPTPTYEFGFALATDKSGKPTKTRAGFDSKDWASEDAIGVEVVRRDSGWPRPLPERVVTLPFIAQCELNGYHELAVATLDAWRVDHESIPNIHRRLASDAWNHWKDEFRYHDADRALVARRINALNAFLERGVEDPFLTKLNLSLKPSGARAGTPEAAIDELLDALWYHGASFSDGFDPREEAVVRLGFDAVPALIAHLDDERVTRSRTPWDGGPGQFIAPSVLSVSHFTADILRGFMCDPDRESNRVRATALSKVDAEGWWKEVKEEGEEAYFVRQAEGHWENEYLMTVLAEKYPKRLPDVFAALKKKPMVSDLRTFVAALLRSSLTVAAKRKVLLEATECGEEQWQAAALTGLHDVAVEDFHKRLVAILGELPGWKDKKKEDDLEPAFHTCIAETVRLTSDAKVWAAVDKYLDGATPEVKIAWVEHLVRWSGRTDVSYARVVACAAAMLTDKTFDSHKNGDRLSVTEVRNSAAEALGELLRIEGTPTNSDEWEAYREKVAKAAKDALKAK